MMWKCNSRNMMERNLFIKVLFLIILIIVSAISQCSSALSNKRLCYDPDCSEPVSLARTTITYNPNESGILSFAINTVATVYSKEAGNRTDLWGVEIHGKRGYVPKEFLREYKILHKNLKHEVSTNPSSNNNNILFNKKLQRKEDKDKSTFDTKDIKASSEQNDNLDLKSTEELPHTVTNVSPSYEIIDGTTVFLNHNEPPIKPNFVKEPIQATVVQNKQDVILAPKVNYVNDKTESNIFIEDDKKSKEVLNAKLNIEKEIASDNVDIKEFVTSSEEVLHLPEISGVNISALNTSVISNEEKHTVTNTENNISTDVRDNQPMKDIINANVSQTSTDTTDPQTSTVTVDPQTSIGTTDPQTSTDSTDPQISTDSTDPQTSIDITASHIFTDDAKEISNVTAEAIVESDQTNDVSFSETNANELKLDVQSTENISQIETQGTQLSENATVVIDIKSDIQGAETSNKTEVQDTPSESVTLMVSNDTKSDTQNAESSGKIETQFKDTQISENKDTNTDTKVNIQSVESIDKIDTKDLQFSESITLAATNDTEADNKNAESTKTDTTDIPFLESVIVATTHTLHSKSITQLEKEQNEFKQEENKNIVEIPVIPLEKSSQIAENNNEFDTKNIQSDLNIVDTSTQDVESDSNIEDTLFMQETTSAVQYDLNVKDTEVILKDFFHEIQVSPNVCTAENICTSEDVTLKDVPNQEQILQGNENAIISGIQIDSNYWLTLIYSSVTAIAVLLFSLGYYFIENMRRDRQLIAKINKLEKDLLISEAECTVLNENLKSTKEKLYRMEYESFGSDEMVLSLRADLEASQNVKAELEDQVTMLEKDLESATEAGLELERMLREVLSSNNEVNPLAQSVEDLQTRLNAQQAANESLTNALNLKTQELEFDKVENESLSAELASVKKKYEELEVELTRVTENLKLEVNNKKSMEQTLTDKLQQLEMQIKGISTEKAALQKELKSKEIEAKDLVDVIHRLNSNNLDLDKLYDVSCIKAEATTLLEERNELKIRLAEVEGAHNLLEEHVKVVKEEVATLSEQCRIAEKEKKDAETRLEVLTTFFEEKEAQRQKEEAIWLQQQGEVVSTVERIQSMQSELQNYKQQIEMLKREILDQEREYKNQMSLLEIKAHEQWVIARQVERRLEESKVEAGQLRNRLTLIEKNINDVDSEAKLHRLEANGETTTSSQLFLGAESSNSPIMFSSSSSVPPPPPPSYLHSLFPPYLPPPLPNTSGVPPYEVSQRPPPLGGRLSSPPPMPLHPPTSNRYDNASSPPPMSPHFPLPFNHRSPPPPFSSDIHPPPPPPGSILPPPLGTPHTWGEESLPPPRSSGLHPSQRDRIRNHKGSLHSSGESLDKLHYNSKV